jgi:branched-chain amino acid transport system substrate-binding protein
LSVLLRRFGLVALVGLLLFPACSLGQPEPVEVLKVGVIAPFEGDFGPLGRAVRDGALLAAETWNQRGGVLGRQVQLVLKDSACDYQEAREAAQAAIDEEASFLIGAVCAGASEGVAQVASEAGALQISPASVDLDLTVDADGELRPLVFRVPVVDPDQGVVAARFALDQLASEQAAVLYAEESEYGEALAEAFVLAYEAGGGEVLLTRAYDQNAELFFDDLEEVREAEPDLIYMPGYYTVANVLVAQARNFGMFQTFIGSDGWDSPDLDLTVVEGSYYTTHYYPEEPRAAVRTWAQVFEQRYLVAPDVLATLSYDAATVLFSAIEEAGTLEPLFVAQTMATMSFELVTGELSFDALHNPVKSLIMLHVREGRQTFVGRFLPQPAVAETGADEGE